MKYLLCICTAFVSICLHAGIGWKAADRQPQTDVFTGSTPCDSFVRSLLKIPEGKCEFIRWTLLLQEANAFVLDINFGEGQPNTSGFRNGGQYRSFQGHYTVRDVQQYSGSQYQLQAEGMQTISLLKLNDNLLHLLDADGRLLTGNGGWSYTLSRKNAAPDALNPLFSTGPASFFTGDTVSKAVFEGRTPCQALTMQYNLPVQSNCFKLKWLLTLYKDPVTHRPASFQLKSTLTEHKPLTGKWSVLKTTDTKGIFFCLEAEDSAYSFCFRVGDEHIIFLTDKEQHLLSGDENFSYTLNRKNR